MKRSLLVIAVIASFALAAAAQTSNNSSMEKSESSSGKSHGVTGCLEQGSSPGTYVIKNAKHPEGVQVSYSGSEDLSKHVGHKVHATGSMSGDTLAATNVKHISETCSVGSASTGKHHHGESGETSNTSTGGASSTGGTSNPKQ